MSINFNNNVISIKLKKDNFNFLSKTPDIDKKTQMIKENLNNLIEMLNRILNNDKINEISYEKIYTLAYKICNEKANKELYDNLSQILHTHLKKIYNEIEIYFLEFREMSEFVSKMIETYKDFSYRVNIIQKTLLYYEKNFLQKQDKYEENIKLLSDNIFFDIFINDRTQNKIVEFVNINLNKSRENQYLDKIVLRSLIVFFIEIKPKDSAYRNILEPQLVISTIQYFQKNFYEKNFIIDKNYINVITKDEKNYAFNFISSYIKELYKILIKEESRYIEFNLIISKKDLIENILESLLFKIFEEDLFLKFLIAIINEPNKEIIGILRNCLDFPIAYSESYKGNINISNCNKLIQSNTKLLKNPESSKIKQIKDALYCKFSLALETIAKIFLEKENNMFLDKKSNSLNNNINSYIDLVISKVDSLLKLIENVDFFKLEAGIINDNQYTQLFHTKLSTIVNNKLSKSKDEKEIQINNMLFNISKILAIHIDYTLKNYPHKYNYEYVENYFERIMLIFRLIEDKDIFEINNRKFLSQRILSQIYNEDLELKLINKLKLENGTIFTFRSEIMINDIKNSFNIYDNYRTSKYYHRLSKGLDMYKGLDINFKILTQASWIINQEENINSKGLINMIKSNKKFKFLKISERFEEFYKDFFPGKLLNYNISYSTCELYSKINGKHYNFTVSFLQGLILLCFNYQNTFSVLDNSNSNDVKIKTNSNLISILKLYSYFSNINKSVFFNSLIPLIKLGLIKLIFLRENTHNNTINNNQIKKQINHINNSILKNEKTYILFNLNTKDSAVSIFELLSNYFENEKQKELLDNHIDSDRKRTKSDYFFSEIDFNINNILDKQTIVINNICDYTRMNFEALALEINLNFNSRQQKLRIHFMREKEKKNINNEKQENKENEDESETLKIERKYQIESNIIRILKCKKTISHQELVTETLSALSRYFVPNIAMIKMRLENLIERGFISRDKNDYNKFIYEM